VGWIVNHRAGATCLHAVNLRCSGLGSGGFGIDVVAFLWASLARHVLKQKGQT
jgi:hypothetical protein